MKITCHACDAKYTIADEKVTGRTVKIKCKKCGATIVVNADPSAAGAPAPGYGEAQAPAHGPGDDDGLMATRVAGGGDMGAPSITAADWTVSVSGEDERQMSQLQIAEEMQRGVVTADTYVWRDGMTDWLPVAQVPELAALFSRAGVAPAAHPAAPARAPAYEEPNMGLAGTMVMSEPSAAPAPFAPPRPAAGASPYAPPAALAPVTPSPGLAPVGQATAARRANRPGAGVDVFAAAAESKDAGGPPRPPTPAGRLGERNENSVLFSLSSLNAAESAASKGAQKSDDAVLDFGFGRGGNGKSSAVDDLMNMGGGAIGGPMLAPPPLLAPVVEPPPAPVPVAVAPAQMMMGNMSMSPAAMPMYGEPQQKSKKGLFIGIAAAVVVLGGIGLVFALGGSGPTAETTPSGTPTTLAATVTSVPTAVASTAAPTATATEAPATTTTSAPAASSAVVASNDTKTPSSGSGGGGTGPFPKASSATTTPTASAKATAEPAPVVTTPPATTDAPPAGRDFNKGAATAALSGAAGAAKGCKQAGGPTGSASVRVVFAPSGNVTSANVQGPPFAGTPVGGCIAAAFRGAHVPAFDGSPVAVSKTVNIN